MDREVTFISHVKAITKLAFYLILSLGEKLSGTKNTMKSSINIVAKIYTIRYIHTTNNSGRGCPKIF